jgi:hypothetical protein
MIPVSGTDAKAVALNYIKLIGLEVTPQLMARTIKQAKTLLAQGYSPEEIIRVTDYLVIHKGVRMHSFGYVASAIDDTLAEFKRSEQAKSEQTKLAELLQSSRSEVQDFGSSRERNERKASRFGIGVQSRFGTQLNLDMLEGHRQGS